MIQSPCLNCPNRYQDKSLCAGACVLLRRLQAVQAARLAHSPYTAVDSADEGRYRLMTAYESHRAGIDGLSLY
jgi:hypothetical protein